VQTKESLTTIEFNLRTITSL